METALDWFYNKIKGRYEHDGDLFEDLAFAYAVAKQKERKQKRIVRRQTNEQTTIPNEELKRILNIRTNI